MSRISEYESTVVVGKGERRKEKGERRKEKSKRSKKGYRQRNGAFTAYYFT
tara:strand:- start:1196 stop:1348 length:153 start_codon:yes stop_codon:yes gene_type:complete